MANNGKNKQFSMNLRGMENLFRYRRMPIPKRSAEFIALIAVSCALFLFLHTKSLNTRLQEMEEKLQPSDLSSTGLNEHSALRNELAKPEMIGVHKTYQYLKSTGQYKFLKPHFLNNTQKAEVDILIFNRVPKVGSMTMMSFLDRLADVNDFDTAMDKGKKFLKDVLDPDEERNLAETIMYIDAPYSYSHHVNYINFSQFGLPKPIYINLVREPVERIISWYHYVRTAWYIVDRKKNFPDIPLPAIGWIKKSYEDCVEKNDPECTFEQDTLFMGSDHRRQMLYFCGHNREDCAPFNSVKTLQIAKRNVEMDYAVVGSWEDTNITLTVLEHYIPRFFKGAYALFYKHKKLLSITNRNTVKPQVDEKVKQILRRNFTNEIEFYQFCKQRLYKQYLALRLPDGYNFT